MGPLKSVDTNILARYVVGDDPDQAARATLALAEPSFVSLTVLLELAWLLSSRYGMDRATLAATLGDIAALPTIHMGEPALVEWAIDRFSAGADVADMIHIIASRNAESFVTFESRLARLAGPDSPIPIETLA